MVEQVVGLEFIVTGEEQATAAIKRVAQNQDKLRNDILRGADALQRIQSNWEKTNRLLDRGTINTQAAARSQVLLARELAMLNGYVTKNGALNTQRALAELRAAQATKEAATESKKSAAAIKAEAQANKEYRQARREATAANQRHNAEAKAAAAQAKQAAAADAALAREKDRLIQKLNPLRSASMLYEKELRDINEATRLGAINDRQRQQSLDALNAEFQAFSTGAQGAAMANNRFGAQSQMAGRKTNQLGVLMQQTGYQVGDFAVQVQGGTNVMVALGQQATQLVGTFGMLSKSTRMIGVFAGLGILIPILTGVGAAFMRMRESADEATKEITREVEKLSQAIGSLNSIQETTAASFDANLNSVFGETAESVSNLLAAIKEVRFENAMLPVQQTVDTVRASVDAAAIQMNRLVMLSQQSPTFRRFVSGVSDRDLENIKASVRANIELVNAQDEVRSSLEAITESRSSKELIDNFASALTLVESIGGPAADDLQNALIEAAKEAGVYEEIIRQAGSATEDVADAAAKFLEHQKGVNDLLEAGRRAEIDRNRTYMSMMREKGNEMAMQAVINQYGQDSVQVAIERARQEAIVANLTAEQRDNFIAAAVEAYNVADAAKDISNEISVAVTMANNLASALESAASAGTSRQRQIAILRAQIEAAQSGSSTEVAGARAGTEFDIVRAGGEGIESRAAAAIAASEAATLEALKGRLSDLTSTPTSPSGGASNVVDINAILDSRRQQIEQERVLLGLSGQQREAQAIYFSLLKQNEDAVNGLTDTKLMGAANVLAAAQEENRVIEEGLKRQQDISNLLESSMERAFMSIVDGTMSVKDAFKAMASDIIKELYRIFVVKQITGMIANAVFPGSVNANGNAFSNGNVVPFADGGVVGSPTTFPMAGGKTGLMGEAGPEAIMPLKRGKDGKLGVAADGGGSVNIVQNFNISANGDDSVKRIIRQQIPQIAEATKAAVVDAKRRGGSYGRAFG